MFDDKWGEVGKVYYGVYVDWEVLDLEVLCVFCCEWFVGYKVFKVFEWVDVLFCNVLGKVIKQELCDYVK